MPPVRSTPLDTPADITSRDSLLSRVRERIVRFATSRLAGDVAEDLAQEVLILLSTKYRDKTEIEDLMPLAFRIVRFKMLAYRRRTVRRGEHVQTNLEAADEQGIIAHDLTPEDQARRREVRERLLQAAGRLTGRCRDLFRLKIDGRSFPEIREAMGAASINTVYTWDARCRQSLLQLMGGAWEL